MILYLLSLLLSAPAFLFSAVPPSTNPSSKLNKQFRYEVEKALLAEIVEANAGRVRFKLTDATPPLDTWSSLLTSGVRSIRIVVLEKDGLQATYTEQEIADLIDTEEILSTDAWTMLNHPLPSQLAFRVRVRKYATCACTHLSTTCVSNAICTKLSEELGWICAKNADLELHVLLDGSRLTVEIPLLIRPHTAEELPKPGFKRVESFALIRTAQIQPGDTVLDPMCGCGTFLIEAATMNPHDANKITYLGVDSSPAQLLNAQANVDAARVKVQLNQGDARRMVDVPSGSIDKIVSCPPFGRQFGSPHEIPDLYDDLLQEWSRVLKHDGRMVLLMDTANVDNMVAAVEKAGCHVDRMREYFRLGKIKATILIIERGPATSAHVHVGRFDWEVGPQKDRALWARLRSGALPALIPFSYIISSETTRPP
jgi:23S rRNA G2445 N2-methylase RlmL